MTANARKFSSALRKRMHEVGQAPIADALKVDVSVVSRMFSEGRIDQLCLIIDALGFKVMPATAKCLKNAEELEHLMWLARKGMESMRSAEDLVFEDPE